MDHSDEAHSNAVTIAVIETDTFCERCGFNLHTQRVWRDGRLGILVTRCPECGAHQAAGRSTTTVSAWLRRLALLGLLAWIGVALLFVVSAFFTHLGITASTVEGLTYSRTETIDGRAVGYNYNSATSSQEFILSSGTTTTVLPKESVVQRTYFVPTLTDPASSSTSGRNFIPPWAILMMTSIFAVSVFLIGVIVASGTWFWRRGWRWMWLVLPTLAGLIDLIVERQNDRLVYTSSGPWTIPNEGFVLKAYTIGVVTTLQIVMLSLGIWQGLRIARFAVSVIVPPKSRQLFAFLWHADGKAMTGPERV